MATTLESLKSGKLKVLSKPEMFQIYGGKAEPVPPYKIDWVDAWVDAEVHDFLESDRVYWEWMEVE